MTVRGDVSDAELDSADAPFAPPYRNDAYTELSVVELSTKAKLALEAQAQTLHQQELMGLVEHVPWCPAPVPYFLQPNCLPSGDELVRSQRMHAVLQLLAQIREQQHQALLCRVYKTFGADHRRAAKELYARELFSTAYIQYYTLYACLSCDQCRRRPAAERHATTVDLLEKLAVTCLRAGWPADAARFAAQALRHARDSPRARIWLATAQLALGDLPAARANLTRLPPRGAFPRELPPWIEPRVQAQRAVLARLEREATGAYDLAALALDARDAPPPGPHFTTLLAAHRMPKGALRTRSRVARHALLLVVHPAACAACLTAPDPAAAPAARPATLHAEDPALLVLARLADALYTQAQALADVRGALLAAGTRADAAVADLVGNSLRAAAMFVAQTYSVAVPHAAGAPARPKTAHAGHAVYLPLIDLRAPEGAANTYATFCGPHLFLRAACDLEEGVALAFDAFDKSDNVLTPIEAVDPRL